MAFSTVGKTTFLRRRRSNRRIRLRWTGLHALRAPGLASRPFGNDPIAKVRSAVERGRTPRSVHFAAAIRAGIGNQAAVAACVGQ